VTTARKPLWLVTYEGRDITADLAPYLLSATYTDELRRHSDTVDLEFEDGDGRWRGAWFPSSGDRIELRIGYEGEPLLDCGAFRVDEPELAGPPDQVTIRGLAATLAVDVRTRRHRSWENYTLAAIVDELAQEYGLEVSGTPPDVTYRRITQRGETALQLLQRLAGRVGCAATIRGSRLVFVELLALERDAEPITIRRADLTRYQLKAKSHGTYQACEVQYYDPDTRETRTARMELPSDAANIEPGADVLRRRVRVDSIEEAQRRATVLLEDANRLRGEGSLALEGDPRLCAGVMIDLQDMDRLGGLYTIHKSTHRTDRRGYVTEIEVHRPPQEVSTPGSGPAAAKFDPKPKNEAKA
jgi:Bacteriophage probable baseplate hub protein